jgi:hypothetical protein
MSENPIPIEAQRRELIDPQKAFNFNRGKDSLASATKEEMTRSLRENFLNGDRIYLGLNNKIGDMVQATAFVTSLMEAQRLTGSKTPISLMIPVTMWDLYEPLAKRHGLEMIPSLPNQSADQSLKLSKQRGEKNNLFLELDNYEGEPVIRKEEENGMIRVRDLFSAFNAWHDNRSAGRSRYAYFMEDLLGLKRGVLNPDNCQTRLPLPENSENIFQDLVNKFGIDLNKKQIAISLEASTAGRMYDRWDTVISQLKGDLGESAEINVIYNSTKSPHEITQIDIPYWQELVRKFPGVRLVSGNLKEVEVLMANQSVVIATDSGLSHIAGAIEGGPKTISLYIPPQTEARIWVTNQERMIGIEAPIKPNRDSQIGGEMSNDPKLKWVNGIPPESIAKKAEKLIRSRSERPNSVPRREEAIVQLYQDILGRTPTNEEGLYYYNSGKTINQIAEEMSKSEENIKKEVTGLYRTMLKREPDSGGLAWYIEQLSKGTPLSEIQKNLIQSDEFLNTTRLNMVRDGRENVVFELYRRILGRKIDPEGVESYIKQQVPVEIIIESLLNSDEFLLGI